MRFGMIFRVDNRLHENGTGLKCAGFGMGHLWKNLAYFPIDTVCWTVRWRFRYEPASGVHHMGL